jgi:acyl-CoA dehydrogenase
VSDPAEIARRVRAFVREVVIPAETRDEAGEHGPAPELREELQAAARAARLLAPHVGTAFGGLGLDVRGQAPVFEEAGYSLLGPLALNCAAPDEGNMHLLEAVADPASRSATCGRWRQVQVRSAFAMTEPAPGAGSDPTMLLTRPGVTERLGHRRPQAPDHRRAGLRVLHLHGAHGR